MINRNFTLLWVGQIISQLGDRFYAIALAWWVLQKTNSPSIMGVFLLTTTLPNILVGFFAGALVDRWRRKSILISTDVIRAALVLFVYYFSTLDSLELWHIFLAGFGISLATAFFDPALQAIIPEVVDKENLLKANGMYQMIGGLCKIAGPLLGATAIGFLGWNWVFLINSASYFVSAVLACFLVVNGGVHLAVTKEPIWTSLREGFRFIKEQKRIVFVLKIIALAHVFVGCLTVLLPFLANGLDGVGVNNLGYLEMTIGIGLVGGSVFIGMKKNVAADEQMLSVFILAMGFGFAAIGVAQYFAIRSVFIYMLLLALIGTCIAFAAVFWQSLLQRYTPDSMRGRVFGLSSLIGNTSLPMAYGLFGVLLGASSIAVLMTASGLCLIGLSAYYLITTPSGTAWANDVEGT